MKTYHELSSPNISRLLPLPLHRLIVQFTEARPEFVNGVVYIAGGCRNTGKLAKVDLPALVIRGSRDPFTPEKVTPTTAVDRL